MARFPITVLKWRYRTSATGEKADGSTCLVTPFTGQNRHISTAQESTVSSQSWDADFPNATDTLSPLVRLEPIPFRKVEVTSADGAPGRTGRGFPIASVRTPVGDCEYDHTAWQLA